jgi:triosephosphate isomerase
MQKRYLVFNWKSYLAAGDAKSLATHLLAASKDMKASDQIIVAPSLIDLHSINEVLSDSQVAIASQDAYPEEAGAYTGEVTLTALTERGIQYCLVAHSEKRVYRGVTNLFANKLMKALIAQGITPIYCFGEDIRAYNNGDSLAVIQSQLLEGLAGIDTDDIILAYEPVWSIRGFGGAESATPDKIQKNIDFVRNLIGPTGRLLYGGSVDKENLTGFMSMESLNGLLVGSASAEAGSMKALVQRFSALN